MGKLQKYIITDGSRYVSKITSKNISFSKSASFAIEMSFEKARKMLLSNKTLEGFYIEGAFDFVRITKDELFNIHNETKKSANETDDNLLNLFMSIDKLVLDLCAITVPNKHSLISNKDKLVNNLSYFDRAKSDIEHWIEDNNPPAHIRAKAYGYIQKYRKYHTEIKEKIRYIEILMEFSDNKYGFAELPNKLQEAKTKPYTPNTPIYAELNALLSN